MKEENNKNWPLDDNEKFAQFAITKIEELLPRIVGGKDSIYCTLVNSPTNRELMEKYFVPDDADDLFSDDEDVSVFTPENMPDEINYVKIYYEDLEFVLFLDEYGINDEFTPCVHLLYLCNHDIYNDKARCEALYQQVKEESDRLLPDIDVEISYSENEKLNSSEDILDIRPYIDLSMDTEVFAEAPDKHLHAMLECMISTVKKDVEAGISPKNKGKKYNVEGLSKAEFEDKVLDELVRFAKQHRDLSVNMRVARKVVSDIIGGCPDGSSLVDYITRQLPELKNKADKSMEMLKAFKYDIKYNEAFLEYWKYYEDMKPGLTPINQMALKLGLDVNVYTNGVEYNSVPQTIGLYVNDSAGDLPLKHHISIFTKLFHSSKLKHIMSVVEPFQKEFAEYVREHRPAVLAEAEKYRDYTIFNVYAKYDPVYGIPNKYVVEEIRVGLSTFCDYDQTISLSPLFAQTAGVRRAVYEAMRIMVSCQNKHRRHTFIS